MTALMRVINTRRVRAPPVREISGPEANCSGGRRCSGRARRVVEATIADAMVLGAAAGG